MVGAIIVAAGLGVLAFGVFGGDDDAGDADTATPAAPIAQDAGLNISCFAYRDVDRDGVYDLDDVPYAGLVVEGTRDESSATASSNTAGFANFRMLLGGEQALVDRAGEYSFEATPPDGWSITSGPARQEVEFVEVDGSPAGVGPMRECRSYGLAPDLTISGEATSGDGAGVTIESEVGPVEVEVSDGVYRASVGPGVHTVADGTAATRQVDVVDVPVLVSRPAEDRARFEQLETTVVVTFDDFTAANTLTEVPSGYGGLDWANWVSTHRILYGAPGYVNVGASGEFVAYNSSGQAARVSSAAPFDFAGAYMGVAWPDAERHDVVLEGRRDGEVVYSDSVRLSTTGAIWFDADYRRIDELEISSDGNWQVVLDDATFRTS